MYPCCLIHPMWKAEGHQPGCQVDRRALAGGFVAASPVVTMAASMLIWSNDLDDMGEPPFWQTFICVSIYIYLYMIIYIYHLTIYIYIVDIVFTSMFIIRYQRAEGYVYVHIDNVDYCGWHMFHVPMIFWQVWITHMCVQCNVNNVNMIYNVNVRYTPIGSMYGIYANMTGVYWW